MKILSDYHHGALYYSMHLLFERRLGWELYRPIGYEWYRRGYWAYSHDPEIIRQFLEEPKGRRHRFYRDWARRFSDVQGEISCKDGIYHIPCLEGTDEYCQKAVTFKSFLEMDFDYVIATVSNHERSFYRLIQQHKRDAVLIRQLGNPNEICDFNICRNIMNSTTRPIPPEVNQVSYHPEFSLRDYRYAPPENHKTIKNFMNCLPDSADSPLWYRYKRSLPEFTFKMHGLLGEDGLLPCREVPSAMRGASFLWHLKSQGDGYGYVIHNAYACGRPLILKKSYYRNQIAEPLFIDGETCINLEGHSVRENVERIRYWSIPENHLKMCKNAYKRFRQTVDFDGEFMKIRRFLGRVK